MLRGRFLEPGDGKVVVLGRKIARSLQARVGDRIAVITQAADGSLGNDLYRVVGILKSLDEVTDRSGVLMPLKAFAELLVLPGRIHEVALRTPDAERVDRYKPRILSLLQGVPCEVRTWREIAPALSEALSMSRFWTTIMLTIVFSIACLGILNTMLMAVFERMHEIGLMLAVGLKPARMVGLIFAETLMLIGMSEALGLGLGLLWSWRLMVRGWDLTGLFGEGFEYTGFAFDNVLHAAISAGGMVQCMGILLVIAAAAGLYPAVKAARLKPVEVMQG